jgi:hypothetical protein
MLNFQRQKGRARWDYMDASFHIDLDDSQSQPSFVFMVNGGEVRWKGPSKIRFPTLLQKLSTLLPRRRQKKVFGSRTSCSISGGSGYVQSIGHVP